MRIILATMMVGAIALSGCGDSGSKDNGKLDVVAAFYPLAEATRQIGGPKVNVTDLTPPGAEPHDLEPTTDDLDAIESADLDLIMGRHFQTAIETAVHRHAHGEVATILDAIGVPKGSDDPHVWLDPVQMHRIVDAIRKELIARSGSASYFDTRATKYLDQVDALDTAYRTGLARCASRVIVTSHEAFGWLAKRYGLEQHAIAGLSPDQEPDPRHIAELTDLVKADHVTTVFTEDLVSPKIAKTLAREAGIKTEVLSPIEALTKRQLKADADYISVMRDNLRKLRIALSCT